MLKLPADTPMADRVRMNTLSLATDALAQTPSFWHAGTELLRSKSLDRNSYNSGDWFNRIDWTGQDQRLRLGPAARRPTTSDTGRSSSRCSPTPRSSRAPPTSPRPRHPLSTCCGCATRWACSGSGLPSSSSRRSSFPNSGTDAAPGVIVMLIDDLVGEDVDPKLEGALVVFNAGTEPTTQTVAALEGRKFALTPALAKGSDPVVKTTTWDAATGTITVPARTAVVLVETQRR